MVLLLWRSAVAAEAVRRGLTLCARSVIPALFPYFVVSGLFISLGFADGVGRRLEPLTRRLFGVGGAGASAFFLGLLGGYPVGGRTVGQLYRAGRLSKNEAERLLAFCNNAGPSFILGVVGDLPLSRPCLFGSFGGNFIQKKSPGIGAKSQVFRGF